ncbi:hypothetical protein [Streptomyces profundus]|uniref:hypothetical protein n=1 Tax=Streptomyces profundus TaxID=2867410 RepID=UPI001D16802C|nr:hypothetical protein [Streptomyces sp. MA3_2.13]UED86634.1 hypothetical protein K4G22_22565 [Streptomyces sp. MA3_2.13]
MNDDRECETERDAGPPDAFMLALHERRRRRLRTRLRISVPLAALTVLAGIVALSVTDWPWLWIVASVLTVVTLVGCVNFVDELDPERPRPHTPREAAVVVGVEITTWSNAGNTTHTARVIGRPMGSTTDQLVYGTREFDAEDGCHIRPGMLFAFRRHPTMRHLVWIEPHQDPRVVLRLRDQRARGRAGIVDAVVESVTVDGDPDGDWWPTTVLVSCADRRLSDTRSRLPEELALLEPGTPVRVAHAPMPGPGPGPGPAILPLAI